MTVSVAHSVFWRLAIDSVQRLSSWHSLLMSGRFYPWPAEDGGSGLSCEVPEPSSTAVCSAVFSSSPGSFFNIIPPIDAPFGIAVSRGGLLGVGIDKPS